MIRTTTVSIATYEFGDPGAPPVILVHGFASSGMLNWRNSGWIRDLLRAGHRVIAIDQRGHGASAKPHSPTAYSLQTLVSDVITVLDDYHLESVAYSGYSLGARVGWKLCVHAPDRVSRAILGGIPSGNPLTQFSTDQARAFIRDGTAIVDRLTHTYVQMAASIPGNDLEALVCLVEGMRGGPQPGPENAPEQPVLVATGSNDPIIDGSRMLARSAPHGSFHEIVGRNHFNAPNSREFRDAAIAFLAAPSPEFPAPVGLPPQ